MATVINYSVSIANDLTTLSMEASIPSKRSIILKQPGAFSAAAAALCSISARKKNRLKTSKSKLQ